MTPMKETTIHVNFALFYSLQQSLAIGSFSGCIPERILFHGLLDMTIKITWSH